MMMKYSLFMVSSTNGGVKNMVRMAKISIVTIVYLSKKFIVRYIMLRSCSRNKIIIIGRGRAFVVVS